MKNSEFRTIYRTGVSRARGPLVMYVADNHTDTNRLGISVGRKIGGSVIRHRFTRRIREIYRLNNHKTVTGKDIIVVARGAAGSADYHKLEKCYLELLKDHKILLTDD